MTKKKCILTLITSIVLFLCVVTFSACKNYNEIKGKTGIVVDKNSTPSYTTTSLVFNGSSVTPIIITHPATYRIVVEFTFENGEIKQYTFPVEENIYNSYNVGDDYYYK